MALLAAGLPNITGSWAPDAGWGSYTKPTGAFTEITNASLVINSMNGSKVRNGFNFNASRSSSIYGKSQTVQPPAIQLIPQIKF